MYRLTKLELDVRKDSMVPQGFSSTLPALSLFDHETKESKTGVTLAEVDVGWQVVVFSLTDYHRTSKIREIVERSDKRVVFHTQSSLYELVQLEEDDQNET